MIDSLAEIAGRPITLEELKAKPGRRRTLRARGPQMTIIAKVYSSDRAAVVARRVRALAGGPPEPLVPRVLHVDPNAHLLCLSDVPGRPLRDALLERDLDACRRVGVALGAWHGAWEGAAPDGLQPHPAERELEILRRAMANASEAVGNAVAGALAHLPVSWACSTVVHRDLYEEQVMVGQRIGLIDVDDAALGPPELDLGNLVAHLELFERRRGLDLAAQARAIHDGYAQTGPELDETLLDQCRTLALLRLACLNDDADLVSAAIKGVPV